MNKINAWKFWAAQLNNSFFLAKMQQKKVSWMIQMELAIALDKVKTKIHNYYLWKNDVWNGLKFMSDNQL